MLLKPRHEYTITFKPMKIAAEESMAKLTIAQRNCKMRNEADGCSISKSYSTSNCEVQQLWEAAIKEINCTPYHMPKLGCRSKNLCNSTQVINFEAGRRDALLNASFCIDSCQSMTYEYDIIERELVHSEIIHECFEEMYSSLSKKEEEPLKIHPALLWPTDRPDMLQKVQGSTSFSTLLSCQLRKSQMIAINVKPAIRQLTVITQTKRVSFTDQLAAIGNFEDYYRNTCCHSGGVIGLFTGISILSLAELAIWMYKIGRKNVEVKLF